jgi:two-component system KDP operon response regulator KdpE
MSCRTVFTALQWEDQRLMVSRQERPNSRRRVLVVDDEVAIRTLLTVFLESREFAVRTAPDGASALALLQTEPAEVILVDWHMPGISGLDMAVEVRRTNSHIPIALMTGTPRAIQPAALQQVGISRMFVKPFDLEELLAWLRALLR